MGYYRSKRNQLIEFLLPLLAAAARFDADGADDAGHDIAKATQGWLRETVGTDIGCADLSPPVGIRETRHAVGAGLTVV
jgi:hypothetical protein